MSINRKSNTGSAGHLAAICFCLIAPASGVAATWAKVLAPAPGAAGVMLQLTDGTIMVQRDSSQNWMRLTPDASGNYVTGSWTAIAPMSIGRLFFASQVLQNGKVWVLGGEYSGPGNPRTDTATAEIYDPVANSWSTAAPYPNQPGCGAATINYTASVTNGSNVITGIPSTANFYVGWSVSGSGIPAGTTITSIDSLSQVHISNNATATDGADPLTFSGDRPACFGATPSIVLPGGKILAGNLLNTSTFLYTPATNSWAPAGSKSALYNDQSDEEGWVLLSNGNILTYDIAKSVAANNGFAETYNPGLNSWSRISPSDGTALGTLPLLSSDALGHELGPVLRLQDGRALVIGANGLTALYTPGTNTWAAGPSITGTLNGHPATFGADDAPAAILPNGHVILAADAGPAAVTSTGNTTAGSDIITNISSTATFQVGWSVAQSDGNSDVIPANATITSIDTPNQIHISDNALTTNAALGIIFGGTFSSPTQLFDFNPAAAGSISALAVAIPDPGLATTAAYLTRMLLLPTGQLLFADGTNQLYVYTGDGAPNPALRPVINNFTYNGAGNFTLTGKQLNGQSAGADYGDDNQSDSNYPVLRLINSVGHVYYCRTTNWSNVAVGTGTATQTVNVTLNPALPAGNYSAIVSGAGISSFPVLVSITQAQVNGQ